MDQNKYITYGVVAIVAVGFGIGIGVLINNPGGGENTYQAGWDAAKKRIAETGYMIPVLDEITSVSGSVTEVKGDSITVAIRPLEPLADPALDTRIVKIDATTRIYRIVQKDPVVYQKEVQEYGRKMEQSVGKPPASMTTLPTPPQPFTQEDIKVTDIQQKDQVSVSATQNIKEAKEFVAATISVQTTAAIIPPAPAVVR